MIYNAVMTPPLHIPSQRILLADDNDANRLIARTILERSGHVVTTAHNGSHALSIAKISTFDIIILDIMMPVMDGMRALRRLRRENIQNQDIPVFALTAYCSAQDRQRYFVAGFDYVLSKPLRSGDLELAMLRFKSKSPAPTPRQTYVSKLTDVPLLDADMISQLSGVASTERLAIIQSRFWRSIGEKCETVKKSLPDAMRGESAFLSQFRRAIHAVKGASAAIGLARVAHISKLLQNVPPSEIAPLINEWTAALSESRPVLTEALGGARQLDGPMQVSGEDQTETSHHSQNHRTAI